MRYTVNITIPCDEDMVSELWNKFARFGYKVSYYERYATLEIRNKILDDVLESFEIAAGYPNHQIRLKKATE